MALPSWMSYLNPYTAQAQLGKNLVSGGGSNEAAINAERAAIQAQNDDRFAASRPADIDPGRYGSIFSGPGYSLDPQLSGQTNMASRADQYAAQAPGAGYQALQRDATRTGYSPWVDVQRQSIGMDAAQQRQQLASNLASQQATQRSQLAMGRGLSGGAAERLARQGIQSSALGQQQIGAGQARQMQDVYGQDIQAQRQALSQFAPLEQQRTSGLQNQWFQAAGADAQSRQADLNRIFQERQAQRDFDLDRYKTQMNQWGAEGAARAIGRYS